MPCFADEGDTAWTHKGFVSPSRVGWIMQLFCRHCLLRLRNRISSTQGNSPSLVGIVVVIVMESTSHGMVGLNRLFGSTKGRGMVTHHSCLYSLATSQKSRHAVNLLWKALAVQSCALFVGYAKPRTCFVACRVAQEVPEVPCQ
jgi:hypothetical protein